MSIQMTLPCRLSAWARFQTRLAHVRRWSLVLARPSAGVWCRRLWPATGGAPPPRRRGPTTEAMAEAALGLMDALGWSHAHLTGMSLGGEAPPRTAA